MTLTTELIIGAIFVGAITVPLWSLVQLKRFLAATPSICDNDCLDRFKSIVRTQMYLTLGYLGVFVIGTVVSSVLIVSHYRWTGFAVVIVLNAVIFSLGQYHKRIENKTRNLESAPEFTGEYQRIGRSWLKKALPDF